MKKKILSLALALVLCLSLAAPALAADATTETVQVTGLTFTLSNVVKKVTGRVLKEHLTPMTFYVIGDDGAELNVKSQADELAYNYGEFLWNPESKRLENGMGNVADWSDNQFAPYSEETDRYRCYWFSNFDEESFCVMYESAFADIVFDSKPNAADWAQESLKNAFDAGLLDRVGIDPYEVDCVQHMTRAQFATVMVDLYQAMGGSLDDVKVAQVNGHYEPFDDVSNLNVSIAYKLGFVTGTSATTFDPEGTLTREQAAVMLSRVYAKLHGGIPTMTATTFADDASVGGWAKSAVAFMANKEIMSGVGGNAFAPQQVLSIQEAMVMAQRMLENLK